MGWIPEIVQKENTRLAWAKKIWTALQLAQERFKQAQMQLEQANQRASQISLQFEQSYQERSALAETLHKQEARLALLQEQLQQSTREMAQLRTELDGIKQERKHKHTIVPHFQLQKVSSSVKLQEFSFEVVTLNNRGQPINCSINKAEYFQEHLGNSVFLDMIYIPGGTFLMGSPEDELGRESNEGPQHPVALQPFYLSRFPITQAQWKVIAQLPQINRYLNPDPSNFKHPDIPVEKVCWHDAVEFCARLSQLTGHSYRLPSEAEWEFACRAGTTTPFHFGETITSNLANYDGSYIYGSGTEGPYRQQTTSVGCFQVANVFGLSDLHGNVWEWCADSWHENYQDAPSDGSIWQLDESNNYRVLRGGAWYCLPTLCRSTQRHWDQADHAGSGTGFRVVCFAISVNPKVFLNGDR
ncbi:MAG: SUMF1/EgtB/PvdO family nonheme iron enzyme [Pelatocladus maniniholoensis HA4357-MV3]|jgi:formylglycine-generating enzyme required for sulfatase activity|uniref:SUMF1/EgtB/PvdO family nonheme iron enzyme n=1 Tax=Pelatocladus maniniholoensis HA4357-MV3 TaxID=1117104 RepID=A0A9E3H6A1_9NOST|nr:SUMF1/EgtB/PvdO family nonheme iron enzyme [Pelatocladus maniniholoensis HA4357-MV3]